MPSQKTICKTANIQTFRSKGNVSDGNKESTCVQMWKNTGGANTCDGVWVMRRLNCTFLKIWGFVSG